MTKSGKIFISCTHVDKEYLQDLKKYIQPLLRFQYSEFEAWDDTTLITGQKLFDKINTQLDKFGLMICLISPDYLASTSCLDELNIALERNKEGNIDQINIFPIIVRECSWQFTPLKEFLLQPEDGTPIATLIQKGESKDKIYNEIAIELNKTLNQIKQQAVTEEDSKKKAP